MKDRIRFIEEIRNFDSLSKYNMAKVSKQKKREIERAKWIAELPKDSATALITHSRNSYIENGNSSSNNKAFVHAQAYYVSAGWKSSDKKKGYVRGSDLSQGKTYIIGACHSVKDELSKEKFMQWKEHFNHHYFKQDFRLFDKNTLDLLLAEEKMALKDFFFRGEKINKYINFGIESVTFCELQNIVSVLPIGKTMNFSYSVLYADDMPKVCIVEALVAVKVADDSIMLKHCYFSPENIRGIVVFQQIKAEEA